MNKLLLYFLCFVFVAGCSKDKSELTPKTLANSTDSAEQKVANNDGSSNGGNRQTPSTHTREQVGRLEFRPIENWLLRPAKVGNGLVMEAPYREEWRNLPYRPNLGVKQRTNPGMDLGQLKTILEQTLSQSVKKLNTQIFVEAESVMKEQGTELALSEFKYNLEKSSLPNGAQCLISDCDGAMVLDGKPIRTKTLSAVLLDNKNIYSISYIMPFGHEKEATRTWNTFLKSVRLDKNGG